jgi:murein DD-endopeptidase MepM/ murein hydrolase activator NlpD
MPEKHSILNHPKQSLSKRNHHTSLMAGLGGVLLFGMVAAFGTAPDSITYSGQFNDVAESLAAPLSVLIKPDIDAQTRETRVQQGDTVAALLSRLGIQDPEAESFLRSNRNSDALFRQLAPGKTLTAKISANGSLLSLVFPLNGGKDTALLIQRTPQGLDANTHDLKLESRISLQTAVIRHSLFGAADEAGIPEGVATQLADIFGGDIDFHRDLRKGDRFSVIYETLSYMGKPVRTERIVAAELVNDGKTYQAFWYQTEDGQGGYYTPDGRSVKKAFLRSPLEFSRITSGFSTARFHPVLHETRAHRGIDYGAPIGTRVKATGSGVIEFSGIQGGYGKLVTIRHAGDRQTAYGHLSGFAPGIKKGARIEQGDVIGFVGATGLATGPHLHYEFRVGGIHRNPLTLALPDAPPLPAQQLDAFRSRANSLTSQISAIRATQLVMLD